MPARRLTVLVLLTMAALAPRVTRGRPTTRAPRVPRGTPARPARLGRRVTRATPAIRAFPAAGQLHVLGGGSEIPDAVGNLANVMQSRPLHAADGWVVRVRSGAQNAFNVTAYAVCG